MTERQLADISSRTQLLQLAGLSAMGITLPLTDRLAGNSQYLILLNYSLLEVLTTLAMLFPGLPLLLWLVMRLIRRLWGSVAERRLFSLLLVLLSACCGMSAVRTLTVSLDLQRNGIPELLPAAVVAVAAVCLPLVNRRFEFVRQFVCLLAAAGLAVPVVLFSTAGARWQLLGLSDQPAAPNETLPRPVPIVMVVFDGLSGMSLLNAAGEIDRQRFPAFAELADSATMYRNATTVHTRTDHALPAMLTSTLPRESQAPVEADYPAGLFRRIFRTGQYDMTVFEPVTRFCPTELRQIRHQRTAPQQVMRLLSTLLRVEIQMCLPLELAPSQTIIPRDWFGLLTHDSEAKSKQQGLVVYGWDTGRREQAQHFVECLRPGARPGFSFLHIALPHYPWSVLPSGDPCFPWADVSIGVAGLADETWTQDEWLVSQAWDRSLLQTLYADRCLGMILQALRQHQTLDQTLLVVTADHGMCFVPGASLRDATAETLPDLLPVPLLIRQPGQKQSSISDRNVEIIDILPTIADITGMQPAPEWVGSSLLSDDTRARKTLLGPHPSILPPDFPRRFQHSQRLQQIFGTGGAGDRIGRLAAIPALTGRRVSEFAVVSSDLKCEVAPGIVGRNILPPPNFPGGPFTACLQHGRLTHQPGLTTEPGGGNREQPVWLAVAVAGRIVATTRTSTDPRWSGIWTAYVPESEVPEQSEPVELYEVPSPEAPDQLRRIDFQSRQIDELWDILSGSPRFD
jgi:hypothetical protein